MKQTIKLVSKDSVVEVNEVCGFIGHSWDTSNRFIVYATIQYAKYANGIYHITGSGRITNIVKNNPTSSQYGLNIVLFRNLLNAPKIVPIGKGHLNFYRPTGNVDQLIRSFNGFGGGFYYYETGMMLPARIYDTKEELGSWAISIWEPDDRIDFDFYAK